MQNEKYPYRCVSRGTRVGSRHRWRCRGRMVWRPRLVEREVGRGLEACNSSYPRRKKVNPVEWLEWHEGISFQFDNLRIWIQKWLVWSCACWICSLDQWLEGHSSLFSTRWFETYWCEPTNGRWWDVFQRMTPKTYYRQISWRKFSPRKKRFFKSRKVLEGIQDTLQAASRWLAPWKIMFEIVHSFGNSMCLGHRARSFLFGVVFQASGDWLKDECSHHDPCPGWQP